MATGVAEYDLGDSGLLGALDDDRFEDVPSAADAVADVGLRLFRDDRDFGVWAGGAMLARIRIVRATRASPTGEFSSKSLRENRSPSPTPISRHAARKRLMLAATRTSSFGTLTRWIEAGCDGNRRLNRKQRRIPSRMDETNTLRSRALAVAVMLHARSLASLSSRDWVDGDPFSKSEAASAHDVPQVRSIRARRANRSSVMRLRSMFRSEREKCTVRSVGVMRLIMYELANRRW